MLSMEAQNISDFRNQIEAIAIHFSHLLSSFHDGIIEPNIFALPQIPLSQKTDEINLNCKKAEHFLKLAANKWEEELNFMNNVLNLKNQICNQFDQLCAQKNEKEYFKKILNQRAKIIDELFNSIEFDNKQMVGKFCINLMNGFGSELSQIITPVAKEIFYSTFPIATVLSAGELIEFIQQKIIEIKVADNENVLDEATQEIIKYIKEFSPIISLSTQNIKTEEELLKEFNKLCDNKQYCTLAIQIQDGIAIKFLPIAKEFTKKCISALYITSNVAMFLNSDIQFNYEHLCLTDTIDQSQITKVLHKIPKFLTKLKLEFGFVKSQIKLIYLTLKNMVCINQLSLKFSPENKIGDNGFEELMLSILNLTTMDRLGICLDENEIGDNGMKCLSWGLKNLVNLKAVALHLRNNHIGDVGIERFAEGLSFLTKLTTLELGFNHNQIGDNGIQSLSLSLTKSPALTYLILGFYGNNIGDNGMKKLSEVLSLLNKLSRLELWFRGNQIGDNGMESISEGLRDKPQLLNLVLGFWENQIGDIGIEKISNSLQNLVDLQCLTLYFGFNNMGDNGMLKISHSLSNLLKLTDLDIWMSQNHIGNLGIEHFAFGLKDLINLETLALGFENNQIGFTGCENLLKPIFNLPNLMKLRIGLRGNQISSSEKELIKNKIKNLEEKNIKIKQDL